MYFHKVRYKVRAHGVSGLARRSIACAIAYAYRRGVRPCIPLGEPVLCAGDPRLL